MKKNNKYSIEKMIDSLNKSNVDFLEMNKYKGVYYNEIIEYIDECLGTELGKKYLILDEIKSLKPLILQGV